MNNNYARSKDFLIVRYVWYQFGNERFKNELFSFFFFVRNRIPTTVFIIPNRLELVPRAVGTDHL